MATGIELLVAAALCVACPPLNDSPPTNLIQLGENGTLSPVTELPMDVDASEAGFDADAPVETLETINRKKPKLREMLDWIGGKHLRIATLEDFPLSYTEVLENGTRVGHGVSFQIIDFLKKKFNFTYEVVVPQDNIIGSPNDFDRSLIEMVNSSVSSQAEIGFGYTIVGLYPISMPNRRWTWRRPSYPRSLTSAASSTTPQRRWTRANG